jgi:hypothetical protein
MALMEMDAVYAESVHSLQWSVEPSRDMVVEFGFEVCVRGVLLRGEV